MLRGVLQEVEENLVNNRACGGGGVRDRGDRLFGDPAAVLGAALRGVVDAEYTSRREPLAVRTTMTV